MIKKIALATSLLCATGLTQAATISDTDSIALTSTNITSTFTVDMFDDMGGSLVLNSVMLSLIGTIEGDASLESLDASAAVLTGNIAAAIDLSNMSGTVLSASPVVSQTFNATSFDGTIDFGGTSGTLLAGLTDSFSEMVTYTMPMDLAAFIGMGSITYDFNAIGSSNGSGAGNLITQFATRAGAELMITYNYTDNTPVTNVSAPSSVALLGLSLLGVAGLRRKAKK